MPELRSGVRRGRAPPVNNQQRARGRCAARKKLQEQACRTICRIRTRAAAAKEAAEAAKAQKKYRAVKPTTQVLKRNRVAGGKVVAVDVRLGTNRAVNLADQRLVQPDTAAGQAEATPADLGDRMMGDESGGVSADKVVGQEDEGNTAPFPEKVCDQEASITIVFLTE